MQLERLTRRLIRLRQVADHIDRRLDSPLRLDELADMALMSRFHFERVFADYAGETPLLRVRRLRLELARQRIEQGETAGLLDLALDCGYASAEAFSRAFRTRFGKAPSIWPRVERVAEAAIRLESVPALAIQYIPYTGDAGEEMRAFDELRARVLVQGISRERRKGWSVNLSGLSAGKAVQLQAALLSDRLGQHVPGLDHGFLPSGEYAVVELRGSHALPSMDALAERIERATGRTLSDGPVLRSFQNPTYLPAAFEKRCTLYVPVCAA